MRVLLVLLIATSAGASELQLPFPASEPLETVKKISVAAEAVMEKELPAALESEKKKNLSPPDSRRTKKDTENRNMEMAFFQLNRNKTEKALGYFQKAEEEGNLDATVEIATIYARAGKLDELERKVESIADADLKSVAMTRAAGILSSLKESNAYEKAVTYYMNVIAEKNNLTPQALYELGDLMFSRREWEGAIHNLVKLVREHSESEYAQKAYYLLGRIFDELRDKEYARFFYKEAVRSTKLGEAYVNEARERLKSLMPELR